MTLTIEIETTYATFYKDADSFAIQDQVNRLLTLGLKVETQNRETFAWYPTSQIKRIRVYPKAT